MSLLDRIFRRAPAPPPEGKDKPMVRVTLPLRDIHGVSEDELEEMSRIEATLGEIVRKSGVGTLDHNEIRAGQVRLYFHGRDAGPLLAVVRQVLATLPIPQGTGVYARHGGHSDPQAREEFHRVGG